MTAKLFPFVVQVMGPCAQARIRDVLEELGVAHPIDGIPRLEFRSFRVKVLIHEEGELLLGRRILRGVHKSVEVVQHH